MSFGVPLLWVILAGAGPQDPDRPPVPTGPDLTAAEKLIKDVFKDDYAKRTPADRQALARKMLTQALETKDDLNSRFVLLREARDLANQGGDIQTALSAVEELAKSFKIDTAAMRNTLLTNAAKTARTPEEFRALAVISLKLIDGLLVTDDYDAAEKLANTALQHARKSQDLPLANRVTAKGKEVLELKGRFEKLKKAAEKLVSSPEDPAANLLVGRFQCFQKGNWSGGLPHLAKCGDANLQGLAVKELANPSEPSEQIAVGDGWWDLSEKETGASRDILKEHATAWYTKCLDKLSGLSKTKVEKRLTDFGMQKLARGNWVDVTDPRMFNLGGKAGDPISLTSKKGFYQNAWLRQFPKGDFDGVTVRVTLDPTTEAMAWVVYELKSLATYIDSSRGTFTNARDGGNVWNGLYTCAWPKREEITFTILLSDGEYIVYLDGREMTRVKTLTPKLSYVLLEVRDGAAKFDRLQLRKME